MDIKQEKDSSVFVCKTVEQVLIGQQLDISPDLSYQLRKDIIATFFDYCINL